MEKSGRTPVPESTTEEGAVVPLSETVSVPWRAPAAAGVKITLIAQLALTASEAPQLLVCVKLPPALIEEIVSGDWPEFVSVTF